MLLLLFCANNLQNYNYFFSVVIVTGRQLLQSSKINYNVATFSIVHFVRFNKHEKFLQILE
jgi:hypothetical protein